MYLVECTVSGGVTGTRTAMLKQDDEIVQFAELGDAQAEAQRLNKEMNGPNARASFRYKAVGPY